MKEVTHAVKYAENTRNTLAADTWIRNPLHNIQTRNNPTSRATSDEYSRLYSAFCP